jgi:hypothetical protein
MCQFCLLLSSSVQPHLLRDGNLLNFPQLATTHQVYRLRHHSSIFSLSMVLYRLHQSERVATHSPECTTGTSIAAPNPLCSHRLHHAPQTQGWSYIGCSTAETPPLHPDCQKARASRLCSTQNSYEALAYIDSTHRRSVSPPYTCQLQCKHRWRCAGKRPAPLCYRQLRCA